MGILEILAIWFIASLSGALAPGPLSAAVVMQSSRHGRLHGILPMVGHAIVELGIVVLIIIGAELFAFDSFMISLMVGLGGIVIIAFGFLALKDYRHKSSFAENEVKEEPSVSSVVEATTQGAAVSILSPYFLIWWAGLGLSSISLLIGELQVGVGTVFLAGVLLYFTHISTDFIYGAFLSVGADATAKKADYGSLNWVNIIIGVVQIALGGYFILSVII